MDLFQDWNETVNFNNGVITMNFDFDVFSREDKRKLLKAFFSSVHYFDDVVAVGSFDLNQWDHVDRFRLGRFSDFFAYVYELVCFEFECDHRVVDEFDEDDEDGLYPHWTDEFEEAFFRKFYDLLNYLEAQVLSFNFEDKKSFPSTFFVRYK